METNTELLNRIEAHIKGRLAVAESRAASSELYEGKKIAYTSILGFVNSLRADLAATTAESAEAAGMLAERERLMKKIQKNTIEDGYIARDERGRLVYSSRKLEREWDHERSDGGWCPDDDIEGFDGMLSLPDKWFPEVRWADTPKKVKLIILKEDEK